MQSTAVCDPSLANQRGALERLTEAVVGDMEELGSSTIGKDMPSEEVDRNGARPEFRPSAG